MGVDCLTWIPFLCLGLGLFFGVKQLSDKVLKMVGWVINIALVLLMLTIGTSVGINDSIMLNLGLIGFNCVVISLSAMTFSVLLVIFIEKTLLPLDLLKEKFFVKILI